MSSSIYIYWLHLVEVSCISSSGLITELVIAVKKLVEQKGDAFMPIIRVYLFSDIFLY